MRDRRGAIAEWAAFVRALTLSGQELFSQIEQRDVETADHGQLSLGMQQCVSSGPRVDFLEHHAHQSRPSALDDILKVSPH